MTIAERQALDQSIYQRNSEIDAFNEAQAKAESARKQAAADDLAKKRAMENGKLASEASAKANDLARQKIMSSLLSKGTNSINALWEAGKIIPFNTVKEQLAVEEAHDKANVPTPRFGAATMDLGGQTVYGQTNNAGRFFPVTPPRVAQDPKVKIVKGVESSGSPVLEDIPASLAPTFVKTLPPEFQTNEFNLGALKSVAPRVSLGVSPSPNAAPNPVVAPSTTAPITAPLPAVTQPEQPSDSDVSDLLTNKAAAIAPRQFKDKSGTVWTYVGSAVDPTKDQNPDNWQPAK